MHPVLVAVLVLGGLAGVLALVIVLAERRLVAGGAAALTINGEAPRTVERGAPLLATLKEEGIFIPSACGGRGSCGLCKVKITEGGGPLLPTETPHLTEAEAAESVRLSCQVKVRGDLALEISPELLAIEEYEAVVEALEEATYDIRRVRLALPAGVGFAFRPGQFVQLETPAYDGLGEPVYRAYSLASSAAAPERLELLIRKVPRGIATTYVHELLLVGDRVRLNGPYGDFTLRETPAEAVFIAGGSGLAPFESILADMAARGIEKRATLFFGAVSRRDLYDLERMAGWEREVAGFRAVPALSRPAPEDAWEGETGLITDVVARHYGDMAAMEAYLCGSPGMIDACIAVLTGKGLPEDKIYFDKFT